jgi:hypothetical protein
VSAEGRASLAELARLRDEVAADRQAMGRCLDDVREVLGRWRRKAGPDRPYLALAAVALHGYYSALESVCERSARLLDGSVPHGAAWHRDLLSQAMTEVPGLRPAIVPRALTADLLSLLEFRHFFRHAYGVELSATKLRENLDRLVAIERAVDESLDGFDAFLRQAMVALAGGA